MRIDELSRLLTRIASEVPGSNKRPPSNALAHEELSAKAVVLKVVFQLT